MMSSAPRDEKPPNPVKRSWPTWHYTEANQGKDAIKTAIANLFWQSMAEAISLIMSDTIEVAKRAGINVLALAKTAAPVSTTDIFDPTEEEKAFTHVARCLLQSAGLFDIDVLLEDRGMGDRIGAPIEALDWLFTRDLLRFTTRGVLRWGNAHGSVLWGPLKFETGIKTEDKQVDGILITSRFNPVGKRPALRLVPANMTARLHTTDMEQIPLDTVSRIPTSRPFALIKEVIDGLFVQVNNRDVYTEAVLDKFVFRTLELYKYKVVQRLSPSKLEEARNVAVQDITSTWMNYQNTRAFEKLVLDQSGVFVDLVWSDPDITRWTSMFQNCQHFCSNLLKSKCFLRVDGYDRAGLPRAPVLPDDKKYESSLPSILKVFALVDDQSPRISPTFAQYFDSVTRSKEGATMVSFKEPEVEETLKSQPGRASLLDMRMYGIPILPGTVEYSKTNLRLGLRPDEPNDAWFAISAATLYFVAPTDPLHEITQKLESTSRATALGILGLGMFEWLEKAANPRLLNSIMFDALMLLTEKERQDIHDDVKYAKLLKEAQEKLAKAKQQGDAQLVEKCTQRVLAIEASRRYEVDIPKLRAKQRGSWDFLAGLN
ncbi:hypothetical protein E1B28_013550 [Marasmius oreades]|uniref:Uncharacterized protein n=1 Tax=Marasmius oreades TaxID=181124 RepID=A0A9P7RQ10_9AGAR|nr:uncharacterized protein E1B28_013550 [Marasmius oreades]KAG7087597.1 hypothetical protein E1B28_013550 [Marasmius oreades]